MLGVVVLALIAAFTFGTKSSGDGEDSVRVEMTYNYNYFLKKLKIYRKCFESLKFLFFCDLMLNN